MLPITPCTLIALAFASCVTASAGSPLTNGGASTVDLFQPSGGLDVLSNVIKYAPLPDLGTIGQTSKTWNKLTRTEMKIRMTLHTKTTQQLEEIISSAANYCATLNLKGIRDFYKYLDFNQVRDKLAVELTRVRDKLAVDLTRVRDQFIKAHAGGSIGPVHLPFCSKIAPKQLKYCSALLFSIAEHMPDVVKSDWILISPLDLVEELIEVHERLSIRDADLCLKFAEIHADHLFRRINLDDGWNMEQLDMLVMMLEHIRVHHNTDGQHVRHAISARLYRTVSGVIGQNIDIARGRITGGVAMLKDILFYPSRYLAFEPAVISSNFLEYGMLYHDPSFQYNPQKSIGSLKPSLYDIIQGLLHAMDPQLSSADRMIFDEGCIRGLWLFYPAHRLEAASVVDALENNLQKQLAFTAIHCALLGLRPPQGPLNMDEPSRVIMVKEWLKWQFLRFSFKCFAANGDMNLALEVLSLLEKNNLVPKWMDRNLLLSDLRKLPKVHQI